MTGIYNSRAFIPLRQIKSASLVANEHGAEMATVRLKDGTTSVEVVTWNEFSEIPVLLIPAEPGWSFLHAWMDEDDPNAWQVGRVPLIGWALCLDNQIRPVTASGVNDGCSEPEDTGNFVEMPNGKVASTSWWAGRASYENADEYFEGMLEARGKTRPQPKGDSERDRPGDRA